MERENKGGVEKAEGALDRRLDMIAERLAQIDAQLSSLRDRIQRAFSSGADAPGGNILIASAAAEMGLKAFGVPADTPSFQQLKALETEREGLERERSHIQRALSEGTSLNIESDTLEQGKRRVRDQIPAGLHLLTEKVVSVGELKTVTATGNTVEVALRQARGEVPSDATVLEAKIIAEPGEVVVRCDAFSEEEAQAAIKKTVQAGAKVGAVRLVASGKRGLFGIGKSPNQYEADVVQAAVVELNHKAKAKIEARVGEWPKTDLASKAERWEPSPPGTCDICSESIVSGSPGTARVPSAQFRIFVDLGYTPRADIMASLVRSAGKTPVEWYTTWYGMVVTDTTDWGLCRLCADDVRQFLARM